MTDQDNERVGRLGRLLSRNAVGNHLLWSWAIADGILSDPSTHIKALIEAGVEARVFLDALVEARALERRNKLTVVGVDGRCYWLADPNPHVHQPYVLEASRLMVEVLLGCRGCTETRTAPSTLPIEWPKD